MDKKVKTKLVSVRIPVFVDKQIQYLVDNGVFSSRSDFINYAIQKALFEFVSLKFPVSDEDLLMMIDLDVSDEE